MSQVAADRIQTFDTQYRDIGEVGSHVTMQVIRTIPRRLVPWLVSMWDDPQAYHGVSH